MITLKGIRKLYRADNVETTALANVNLRIDAGEFVAVMGPSGCGKSTLLNIVGMIDTPNGGEYLFCGENVAAYTESRLVEIRRRHLGFVFQSFNLIDDLTVFENIELPLLYQNVPRAKRKARVREVLELVDLRPRENHKPAQLSGGQQQRVAVARAVVCNPKLILADEPTGNLDTKNGAEVLGMLETLSEQGTTILMVTHSHEHAAHAQRVIDMLDGKVLPGVQPRVQPQPAVASHG
ncbi:MAG: ABC transporter ATP-binding protein [Steroidobacteraceae bacterium]